MAWTNAFDIGDCTLSVHKDGSATAMTQLEMDADGVSVAADAAGLVTLTAPAISGAGGSYEVRVTPAFDAGNASVRITGAVDTGIGNNGMYAVWSPDPSGDPIISLDGSAELLPAQAWTYAGVRTDGASS